ncbi:hypothetical protein [Nitrosomonas sp. Nm132]|jgi:hypothetical protein|uniref:hypothetical protein n=1 Tax=Nitrosomonas sp. Nm132 TaxID=1881053 RepID=UPI00087DFC4E|nr:hypothetical protein [Nitrosomonas sp. Nm132]SDH27117.1 hypothetical protein SAMN05428952_100970 [Nitrosomonas sp. Nm132]
MNKLQEKRILNNMTPGAKKVSLGERLIELEETVAALPRQAAAVDNAAGANPTKAEFDALLSALRASGVIASS